jgi:hypothetical protein
MRQGPCFVTLAVNPLDMGDGDAGSPEKEYLFRQESAGVVCGVVEHLNLEFIGRIIQRPYCSNQSWSHGSFVIEGKLHGDARELCEAGVGLRRVLPMLQEERDDAASVQPVPSESDQDDQITETPKWAAEGK